MPFENSAGQGVLNHYGPRVTNTSFGAVQRTGAIHVATLEFSAPLTTVTTHQDFGRTGLQASAWAVSNLDLVIPAGTMFLRGDIVVETPFNALTGLTIGTYLATNGTTAISANGLGAPVLGDLDAVGDRAVLSGAHYITGAGGIGSLTANAVIRCLYTGALPTTGKARLVLQYMTPTP